jgi:hypothetical protein
VSAERVKVEQMLEEVTEKLMDEEIEVRVFLTPFDLPEGIIITKSYLKGFVHPNVSEFDEEIVEIN